jgi:DNA polymerase III epsilon subunit-like protein
MTFLAIDLETTGVSIARCEIVQWGMVAASMPDPIKNHARPRVELARPAEPIPPGATAVHGITDAMVAGALPFADQAAGLTQEIATLAPDVIVTFNGSAFDLPILARYGVTFPATAKHLDAYRVWQVARDQKARSPIWPDRPHAGRFTGALGSAYAWTTGREPEVTEHDAGADCLLTLAVADALVRHYGLPDCLLTPPWPGSRRQIAVISSG